MPDGAVVPLTDADRETIGVLVGRTSSQRLRTCACSAQREAPLPEAGVGKSEPERQE